MTDDRPLRPLLWKVFAASVLVLGGTVALMLTRWRAVDPTVAAAVPAGGTLAELRDREDAILNGVAWRDRARGRVAIPVERAMARVASAGLPARKTPPRSDR